MFIIKSCRGKNLPTIFTKSLILFLYVNTFASGQTGASGRGKVTNIKLFRSITAT